jgi:hypothetical protein
MDARIIGYGEKYQAQRGQQQWWRRLRERGRSNKR